MKKLIIALAVFLCGCSTMQIGELFFGMSIQDLKETGKKYTETFSKSPSECFDETIVVLQRMNAKILHKNPGQHFIVANRFNTAYELCIDTTELGVLINAVDNNKSEVVVASGNYSLAEFVSKKVFTRLKSGK
ncbi:hypothetical protein ACFL3J_02065 [Candidatus Omnitrophota bacterium]